MNWLFFALLAPFLYAVTTFIDKYIVSKEVKDYSALPIYIGFIGLLTGTVFWILTGFPILTLRDGLIVLLTGVLTGWSVIFYYKAISQEDASIVNILFQMFPVITLILAFIFLKETISGKQLFGFTFVLIGSILISLKKEKRKTHISAAFFLILIVDFFWAISGVLMKFALNANSFSKILSYESWGIGLGALTIYFIMGSVRKAFKKSIKTVTKRALKVIILNELLYVSAKSFTFLAFSLGTVTLVSVLENTQALYSIFLGVILTKLFPSVFREQISKKDLAKKMVASSLFLLGIFLTY